MDQGVLALNAGSSSMKFALYRLDKPDSASLDLLCEGQVSGIGGVPRFLTTGGKSEMAESEVPSSCNHRQALDLVLNWIRRHYNHCKLVAVGHRVVHGGTQFTAPVRIDAGVLTQLRRLIALAPLHQPHAIGAIEILQTLYPDLQQVACFDTAFHHTQTRLETAYALPRSLTDAGIRRYGFHGLSYEYIAGALPAMTGVPAGTQRVIVAHLGAGASLCAMRDGKSVATTMGFTALDGIPMGRRCGSLDPGVILYLMQEKSMGVEAVSDLLYHESGLLGVSGISDDLQILLASDHPHAAQAVDLFVYRINREIGSLAAALGGLDALVFTGGIGEHAVEIRRRVCNDGAWLGLMLDDEANARGGPCISAHESRVSAWVIPANENLMVAQQTRSQAQFSSMSGASIRS